MNSILSTLCLLLVACSLTSVPFFARGQTAPIKPLRTVNPEQLKSLKESTVKDLKAKYQYKTLPYSATKNAFDLKGLQKSGGGVVDGGGGNLSSNSGQLLDLYQYSDLEKLSSTELKQIFYKTFETRIQDLETKIPGFKNWLEMGFQKPWFLDSKPLEESACLTEGGLCPSEDAVRWNRSSYLASSETKKAQLILSVLLHHHTVELKPRVASQAAIELKNKIQDHRISASNLISRLVSFKLIGSPEATEAQRAKIVAQYENDLARLRQDLNSLLDACETMPTGFTKLFNYGIDQYMLNAKMCSPWLRPEIDPTACNIDSIAEMLVLSEHSSCYQN